MAAIAEEFEPWEESPCRGTARIGGNPNWTGTIEHLTIQLYYMGTHPMQRTREYKIPNAGATMGIPGYADIVNTTTGEIFEIKPPSSIQQGASEVANYVTKANAFCANGVPYRPGNNFPTFVLPYFTKPGKGMEVKLMNGDGFEGVLRYSETNNRPNPVVLAVPQNATERLKNLIRKLVEKPDLAEYQIREFFSDPANAQLKDAIKTAVIGAGIAVVVGTIVEDVLSGGLGLMDDIAHFTMAYRAIRFAIAL